MNITNKRNYTDEELEAWLYGEDDEEDLEEKNSFYDIFKPKEVTIPTVYKGLLLDSYLERVAIIVPQECSSVQIGETLTLINEPKSDDAEFITIHSENGLIGFFYNGQYRKKVYKYITTKNHSVLAIAREHNSLILAFYKKSICSDFIALDFETPNRLNDCPCAAGAHHRSANHNTQKPTGIQSVYRQLRCMGAACNALYSACTDCCCNNSGRACGICCRNTLRLVLGNDFLPCGHCTWPDNHFQGSPFFR